MMNLTIYIRNIFGVPLVAPKRQVRLKEVIQEISQLNPKIVLLQEVFLNKDKVMLKELLKKYNFINNKDDMFDAGGGLVALIDKNIKYTVKYIHYKKSGFLTDLSITDKLVRKGFQAIHISDQVGDLLLIHTHLTCPYGKNNDSKMNSLLKSQLNEITTYIEKISSPMCICGDFNIEPDNKILQDFISKNNLQDNSKHISKTYTGNFYTPRWFFNDSTNSQKLDYVLSKNINNENKIKVNILDDKIFISDHLGMTIEIN